MTDPAASEDSPAPRRRPRRRHPALASRIAVTGLSAATMFGIVAALGVGSPSQDTTSSPETVSPPSSTLPVGPATPTTSPTADAPTTVPTTEPVPVTELSNEPIQLTAEPVIRVVETPAASTAPAPQEQAPVASTNGSR